jgi:hypothetical protein
MTHTCNQLLWLRVDTGTNGEDKDGMCGILGLLVPVFTGYKKYIFILHVHRW